MLSILASESILQDRYLLQKIISNTESEQIYLAEDQVQYGEECLIRRMVSSDIAKLSRVKEKIQEEFDKFADLEHPRLQRMKDFFCEGESLFVVQAYIEGESYEKQYQNHHSFHEIEAVSLLKQLLPALKHLHSQSLVHKAISPTNIILRIYDQIPVLTNPGILDEIRVLLDITNSKPAFTANILPDNNYSYTSPPFFDIYSLAATILVLLTGKKPNELLEKDSGRWNWENWILLSDEFNNILDQILNKQKADTDMILKALDSIYSVSQPPTLVQKPKEPTSISHPVASIPSQDKVKASGTESHRRWMVALGAGSLLTLIGIGSTLFVEERSDVGAPLLESSPIQPSTVSPNGTGIPDGPTSNPPNNSVVVPTSPQETSLKEEVAVSTIRNWLQAKSEVFAPPYSLSTINQYTTGEYREDRLGAVNWLKNNSGYYVFRPPSVQSVGQFSTTGQQASLAVKVTEDRTLYVNGKADAQNSGVTTSTYRFTLQLEDNTWKIANAEELN